MATKSRGALTPVLAQAHARFASSCGLKETMSGVARTAMALNKGGLSWHAEAKAQATFASSCGPNSHIFDLATRSIASNNGGAEIPAFTKAHASADSCCAEKPSILARLWTARPSNKSSGILNSAYSKPPRSAPCAAKTACFAKAHAVIDKFCAENVATLLVLETSSPRAWNRAGAKWPRREKDQAMTLPAWASNVEAREAASSATASKRFGASMEAFA
mmetsp:Transcript_2517/g.8863  ORF Transcript_2517/g.8863 Transcript_2517/m.8863 type:complete len:219 (-) Transcript_2517:1903-2559(-)